MSIKVKASVLQAAKDLRIVCAPQTLSERKAGSNQGQEERQLEPPLEDEVQIAISYVGLCGSDLHYFNHFANGSIKVREPLTLGHESSGKILAVGKNVSHLSVGDNVALEVGIPCGKCKLCLASRYNLCPEMRFRSSAKSFPHYQGVLQERVNHPAAFCHRLPDGMNGTQAALLEPLAVSLHALRRASLPDERATTLVLGAGAIGILTALCLKAKGHYVVIADIVKARLEFAECHGLIDEAVLLPMRKGSSIEEELEFAESNRGLVCSSLDRSDGLDSQFDVVFECTGVQSCVQSGIYSAKPGGKLVLVGMGATTQTLQMSAAALREVDIIGVFRYAGNYQEAIKMYEDGKLDMLESLVTHRVKGLASVGDAFNLASKVEDQNGRAVLKVMLEL